MNKKFKQITALLLSLMLVFGMATVALCTVSAAQTDSADLGATSDEADEWEYSEDELEEDYEDEYPQNQKNVMDFEIIKLPDKVFTEPFDGKTSMEILKNNSDDDFINYIRETSVGYNMKGAVAKIYFSDGSTYDYEFQDSMYGNYLYEKPATFYWISVEGYEGTICVEDIGNYQVEISTIGDADALKKKVMTAESASDTAETDNGGQSAQENPKTTADNKDNSAIVATPDSATPDSPSVNNKNNNTNNSTDNTAVQTGSTAPTVLLLVVITSALAAVYFYRRKISK